MNPWDETNSKPNFWLSCLLIDKDAMSKMVRSEKEKVCTFTSQEKSCPDEILEVLKSLSCKRPPLWKPMHMQTIYMNHPFITVEGNGRGRSNAYIDKKKNVDVGADIFCSRVVFA